MSQFCLNPACSNPRNSDQNQFCQGCGANLADSTQSYQFDYYRVTKLLGQGGFGLTYLAEYSRRYNQPRVIKTLKIKENQQNQQKIRELFAREAEQLCNLDHPQIPKLYEYFARDDNLYLVQEFIDGMSLQEEFQQKGAFSEQKIQTILEELLPILAYIEEKNLLHRDIKPDNIMRRRSDGQLMLIDFGAARVKTGRDPTILTAIYTPGYAAIEHMNGRPVKASDVYSLGVTCIRLLTGCFPSRTTDPIYDDDENCLRWKEYLQERNIEVSDRLVAILDKMVASYRRERYSDAQAVLEDLFPSPLILPPTNDKDFKKFGLLSSCIKLITHFYNKNPCSVEILKRKTWESIIFRFLPAFLSILIVILGLGWYLFYKDTLQTTLRILNDYYNEEKYQECFELATNNSYQNNNEVQQWMGKCGLLAAEIKAKANRYRDAIIILQTIPNTVYNYQKIKNNINSWAENILDYSTKVYKQETVEEAIKVTNAIPKNTSIKATIPKLISQWQEEESRHQAIINKAQNLLNKGQWEAAKKEALRVSSDINRWSKKAQSILNEANQHIKWISKTTGVDYNQLRSLLETRKWKEADQETQKMMLLAASKEPEGSLWQIEDINNFSCEDLRIIDKLWLDSSQGKFGFSVQREIWQSNGSPTINTQIEVLRELYIDLGWKTEESGTNSGIGHLDYEDLEGFKKDIDIKKGNLPYSPVNNIFFSEEYFVWSKNFFRAQIYLFSRIDNCKL